MTGESEFQIHRLCDILPHIHEQDRGLETMHYLNDFEQKMWQATRRFILHYLAQCVHKLTEAGSWRYSGGSVLRCIVGI
jgi:hypothetical protein